MTAGVAPAAASDVLVPASHRDLLERPVVGVLTTLGPRGAPESRLVWVDEDGGRVRFNTTRDRRSCRDLERDPRASLLLVDPEDTGRFLQVRGTVELTTAGALDHLDALTRRYTRHDAYYGGVYPLGQQALEERVIGTIHARRITLDAIHR
jgi:PPOX class probable F420-dependent enzyme